MAVFSRFGPHGTLTGITDFSRMEVNGVGDEPGNISAEVLGDRCDLVEIDGSLAFRMKRYAGDAPGVGLRTELVRQQFAKIADWVDEEVPNASLNEAIRQYRWEFMVPEQDLSWLASSGNHCIVWQMHQTSDTDPADTAGLNPALACDIRVNHLGQARFAIVQNTDTDETTTVDNPAVHRAEVASWPLRFGVWESIHAVLSPWSYSSAGNLTVYRNRRPILERPDLPNCPNDSPLRGGYGLYAKFGVYMGSDNDFTVYHRGYLTGDHEATFADMYPELSSAVPLERVSGPVASAAL
jgi:hypothetical protein